MFRNFKIMLVTLGCISLIGTACQKYDGDSYDFSAKERNYIRFAPADPIVVNGDIEVDSFGNPILDSEDNPYHIYEPFDVVVETRMAFTEDITYTYTVDVEGLAPENHTGIIAKGATTSIITLDYPKEIFPAGVEEMQGTIEITSANGADYGDLRLGYPAIGDQIKVNVDIIKPREL